MIRPPISRMVFVQGLHGYHGGTLEVCIILYDDVRCRFCAGIVIPTEPVVETNLPV